MEVREQGGEIVEDREYVLIRVIAPQTAKVFCVHSGGTITDCKPTDFLTDDAVYLGRVLLVESGDRFDAIGHRWRLCGQTGPPCRLQPEHVQLGY